MPPTPTLISVVLAMAMSHPMRLGAFTLLLEGPATVRELAEQLEVSGNALRYHLNMLEKLGCIYRIENEGGPRSRVTEYTYRAVDKAYFDAEGWEKLSKGEKVKVTVTLMEVISKELNDSMGAGAFFDPDDNHISRSPMNVDREGWQEVSAFLDGILDGLVEIQGRINERCGDEKDGTFPIKVAIVQFRSPANE